MYWSCSHAVGKFGGLVYQPLKFMFPSRSEISGNLSYMIRIAIGGIATESCTFSTLPTKLEDFTISHAEDTLFWERYPFFKDYPEVEFVGTVVAKALPGGAVTVDAYTAIKQDFLTQLREKGHFDGVYLDMHGAMNVQGQDDA